MRTLKILIGTLSILAVVILAGIGYVWRELAFTTYTVAPVASTTSETPVATPTATEEGEVHNAVVSPVTPEPTGAPTLTEPITVKTSDLPDAQQKVLNTLGLENASLTITPEMVACAVNALGATRAAEIQAGDAPSLAEGLTLVACMKK